MKIKFTLIVIFSIGLIAITKLDAKTVLCVCKNEHRENIKNVDTKENPVNVCTKICTKNGGVKQAKAAAD